MIGIYKITNKINGKCYVGQSNDIQRRINEHIWAGDKTRVLVDKAIKKYGKEAFDYEILEICSLDQLNEKETYWIEKCEAIEKGYNLSKGGAQQSIGENNGRAKLTEEDVKIIRTAYAEHKAQAEIYEQFKDKVTFNTFQTAWQGKTWVHVMPEVFTEENKNYYIYKNSVGGSSKVATLTDEEVIKIRQRYVNETASEIYKDYEGVLKYNTLQQILWGRTYKNLPIYKKKEKIWVNT